jgi:CRP-like cAMP-binding protein
MAYFCWPAFYPQHHIGMDQFIAHIKELAPLSIAAENALQQVFDKKVIAKNEFLLKEGQVCRCLYFLEKGALRGFYNLDGKEITHWFGFEKDFVTSFHSFITQQAAVENIQLLEGSILWRISKEHLTALLYEHHDVERMVRLVYEKYYIRLEERYVNGQFKPASERYDDLLQQSPHIIERVPLGYIASYLGISQETLSRVRARL